MWFLASFELGSRISYGYTAPDGETLGWEQSGPTGSWIATADGSWAEVALATNDAGEHVVAEGGPRRLWRIVEDAYRTWIDLGQPGWDAFGLTIEPDQQTVCSTTQTANAAGNL